MYILTNRTIILPSLLPSLHCWHRTILHLGKSMQNLWELDRILQIHLDICKIRCKLILFTTAKYTQDYKSWPNIAMHKMMDFAPTKMAQSKMLPFQALKILNWIQILNLAPLKILNWLKILNLAPLGGGMTKY